jgi:transcriptional antiterminator Rof (Rho-off)
MSAAVTPEQIAEWMLAELERDGYLYQETAAYEVASRFGEEYTYVNKNGNTAIRADVLSAFEKLTVGTVVWERGTRLWRKRQDYDPPSRKV